MRQETNWIHPSVAALAAGPDPSITIVKMARAMVFDAVERGWSGPPFDPISLAELKGIQLEPSADVKEARLVPGPGGRFTIQFNPGQPRNRIRYSVAHEIAHTLFPDASERIRYRKRSGKYEENHWQLEALCDLAAAEILMPVGEGRELKDTPVNIDAIARQQEKFEVSMEAALLRVVKLTGTSCAAFAAARFDDDPGRPPSFRIDYCVGSRAWHHRVDLRRRILSSAALARCTAIGYTAKASERWWSGGGTLRIECVGAPPYPESIYPRVVGVLLDDAQPSPTLDIRYLVGDATDPHIDGMAIIAHVVNDQTPNWGAGFGKAMAIKFPSAQAEFKRWTQSKGQRLQLGETHYTQLSDNLIAFHMVAQRGYRPTTKALIRYTALDSCLQDLATFAGALGAAVHMPAIGTGYAGGNWEVIEQLVRERLTNAGVPVSVYTPPGQARPLTDESHSQIQLALRLEG